MADRIMYVKPGCPYCQSARDALRSEGVDWDERDATADPVWRDELFRHSRNTGIVPTVVGPDGVTIGWQGGG